MDWDLLDEFLYRLYGMYLAVLAARMAANAGDPPGHGDSLFPEQPRPRPRNPYPWDAFVGPIPGDAVRHQPRLQPGVPANWRWPQDFIHDLVRLARALAWAPGPAEVSWAELALDYEPFVGRALPASPDHRLRGTRLPLGQRAQVLRKAVGLAERHLAAGTLLGGAPLGRCRSLLPLGGHVCAGLSAQPYFPARHEVMLQLMRLAAHCRGSRARRLRTPARMRPQHSDRFLMDYFPRPLEPPPPPPVPICPAAPAGSGPQRPTHGAAAQPPLRCGQRHVGRALLGAWGAVVCPMPEPGVGYQPLLPSWPQRPRGLLGGLRLPHGPAPGRAGPLGGRPRGPMRGGGGVVLLAGAGPPGIPGPSRLGPPGGTPVHGRAQSAGHALFPCPGAGRLQSREAPDA